MHLFASIVAAGITLYALHGFWQRVQMRRIERWLNPPPPSRSAPWIAAAVGIIVMVGMAAITFANSMN